MAAVDDRSYDIEQMNWIKKRCYQCQKLLPPKRITSKWQINCCIHPVDPSTHQKAILHVCSIKCLKKFNEDEIEVALSMTNPQVKDRLQEVNLKLTVMTKKKE